MSIDRDSRAIGAFRQTYQAVVDRTPVARDLEELRLPLLARKAGSGKTEPRRWIAVFAALAGAATVLIAVGGVALMLRGGDAPPGGTPPVSVAGPFVVLDDPASVLGPGARVTFKESMTSDPASPGTNVEMRLWARDDENRFAGAIALLEGDPEDDLIDIAGIFDGRRTVEYDGLSFVLGEVSSSGGPIGLEWTSEEGHRRYLLIARGFTRDEVLDMAAITARQGGDETGAIPDGLNLTYEGGSELLSPPPGTIMRDLVYGSERGTVQIVSFEGWMATERGLLLLAGETRRVDINGRPGWLMALPNWGVVWTDGDDVTYVVESGELTPDQVVEAARGVRPVSATAWDAIVAQPIEDPGAASQPTASSFLAVTEPSAAASGNGWAVLVQLVEKTEGSPAAGNRGLCTWLEREGLPRIDFGCGFDAIGNPGYWPPFATPDGVVLIGTLPPEAATVRIDIEGQEPIELAPIRLGAESPLTLFAVELPANGDIATITIYDSAGNQLDADPQNERLHMRIPLEPEPERGTGG